MDAAVIVTVATAAVMAGVLLDQPGLKAPEAAPESRDPQALPGLPGLKVIKDRPGLPAQGRREE